MTPRAAYPCLLVVEAVRGRGRAAGRFWLRHLSRTKNGYAEVLVHAALEVALDGRRVLEEVPVLEACTRREPAHRAPAAGASPRIEVTGKTGPEKGCPTR